MQHMPLMISSEAPAGETAVANPYTDPETGGPNWMICT
jgi:hypothetical protein